MILDPKERIEKYTKEGWWGKKTLLDLFMENAFRNPAREALVDPPNRKVLVGSEQKRFTYAELKNIVDRVALHLLELGIKKDDFVMVQLPNVAELVICYLALSRMGAIISTLPIQYRTYELRYTMSLLEPRAFITVPAFKNFNHVEMVKKLKAEIASLKHIIVIGEDVPEGTVSFQEMMENTLEKKYTFHYLDEHPYKQGANEIFTLCWTSGTEAMPKPVPRSHNQWIFKANVIISVLRLWMGDSILLPFPLVNTAGVDGALDPWIRTGGKLVLHHPFDPEIFVEQLENEKINFSLGPPTVLMDVLKVLQHHPEKDMSNLRIMVSGAAPIPPWVIEEYENKYGVEIANLFGGNEGVALYSNAIEIPSPGERAYLFPRWGMPGRRWPVWGTEAIKTKLVDVITGGVITQKGKAGELYTKGPHIFAGYYRRPDLNEKSFDEEGYYKSGDLLSIEGDNLDRYKVHGRAKDLIIRGGQNISPEEIELLLTEHPKISDVAAIGVPDERLGEKVCVYVVPSGGETVTLDEVVVFLQKKDIAIYKIPQYLEVIEKMPRNPLGKVQKNVLRENYQQKHGL